MEGPLLKGQAAALASKPDQTDVAYGHLVYSFLE